ALKTQALAARTYIINYLLASPDMNLPKEADVCDTVNCQVYKSNSELKEIWDSDFDWKIAKIKKAVQETKGEIITYKNNPIQASFFSSSNGYTENSEDYWEDDIPYLKSVPSPWDHHAPKFTSHKKMSVEDFNDKLGVDIDKQGTIGKVIEKTTGKSVGVMKIDGKKFTGRKIREKLGLRSSDFAITRE